MSPAFKWNKLELGKLFPLIPLVAEEDCAFLRSKNLAYAVTNVVNDNISTTDKQLSDDELLQAIDRGGNHGCIFDTKPATYWILDPIDGTRGFLKGGGALYVVGLALIIEGEIVLGVMGCPNWPENPSNQSPDTEFLKSESEQGMIMAAHVGSGTWKQRLSDLHSGLMATGSFWERCFVDEYSSFRGAQFCIPDSQTWESLPISDSLYASITASILGDTQIRLLPTCCGSLCKYLMVASGRASVFILRAKIQNTIKAWDHAVGVICVLEAGGKVTDWEGNKLDLGVDEVARRNIFPSGGVLVTNGTLHGQLLELISPGSSIVS